MIFYLLLFSIPPESAIPPYLYLLNFSIAIQNNKAQVLVAQLYAFYSA
jgi:hypothetical protein